MVLVDMEVGRGREKEDKGAERRTPNSSLDTGLKQFTAWAAPGKVVTPRWMSSSSWGKIPPP